jgi:hypothetical protein
MIDESLLWQSIGSGYLLLSTFCFLSYVKCVVHTVKINDLHHVMQRIRDTAESVTASGCGILLRHVQSDKCDTHSMSLITLLSLLTAKLQNCSTNKLTHCTFFTLNDFRQKHFIRIPFNLTA